MRGTVIFECNDCVEKHIYDPVQSDPVPRIALYELIFMVLEFNKAHKDHDVLIHTDEVRSQWVERL